MKGIIWTMLGLSVTTLISVVGIVMSDARKAVKGILATLTVAGCVAGIVSAENDYRDQQDAAEKMNIVKATVGDLGALNRLSCGFQYYVQIASGDSREDLARWLKAIDEEFRGAESSEMASIRERKPGDFVLVFGQHLDLAAAGVFQQLAMSHHLPPPGQVAYIHVEPSSIGRQLTPKELEKLCPQAPSR